MTGKRRAGRDPFRRGRPSPQPPASSPEPSQPQSPLPAPPTVVIAPRLSRRQARLERRRQQRRRIGLAGGTAIAIAAIVVIALVAFGVDKAVTSGGGPSRSQTTVLMQIRGSTGTAVASALLAHDTSGDQGTEVLVPSRVITDVCGYNTLNFGDVLAKPGGDAASRQALSLMLSNITIDGSWVLTQTQLAKLVDLVGGVTVNVDVDVVQPAPNGRSTLIVPAGSAQHLSGAQAARYATYIAKPNEDASLQLTRLQLVVDATMKALPTDATRIAADLRQLGAGGGSTLGATTLADFLVGYASSERTAGNLYPTDFPITLIDAGGPPSYSVDKTGASTLVNGHLAESLPADGKTTRPTVYLLNGVGTPGLVATTCPRLAAHRLTYAGSKNASSFNYRRSVIAVPASQMNLGYQVADALRLPHSDVGAASFDQSIADVFVTLGHDYRP